MPVTQPFAQSTKSAEPKGTQSVSAFVAPITELPWPREWLQRSIGTVSYAHADYLTNAPRFFLTTAAEGLRVKGDSLFFVFQTNAGVGFQTSVTAMANDFPMPFGNARGIMLRESESPTSSLLFVGASAGQILAYRRDSQGVLSWTNAAFESLPVILKFEQREDKVAAAYSLDHKNWTSFPGYEFPMQTQSLAGFAVWSGDSSNRVTARFVLLSPGENPVKKN